MATTLLDLLDAGARAGAAVRFPELGVSWSAAELASRAARAAGAWRQVAAPGQPVVIAAGNSPELLVAFFGAVWAGLVPTILPAASPFQDPERWIAHTTGTARKARDAPIAVPAFAAEALRTHALARGLVVLAVESLEHAPIEAWAARPEDPAFLQFTSGSLAAPKGVVIAHRAVVANALAGAERFAFQRGETGVYWTPLCHDMALASCLTLLAAGSDQTVLSTEGFARDPTVWLAQCAVSAGTAAPPFAFARAMARSGPPGLDALRVAAVGAEPIDARSLRAFLAWSGKSRLFAPTYGLAETVCGVLIGQYDEELVTVFVRGELAPGLPAALVQPGTEGALELVGHGPPLRGHAVRVVLQDGREAADGVVGHVQLSGPSNCTGYLDDAEATASLFDGAWVRTGDIGFLRDGKLYLVGREKDVIIARGRHVFPEELEAVAADVQGVRPLGVCAFGEPDPAGGPEVITVLFAPEDPARADVIARELAATLADRLGVVVDHLVPVARSELPRTTSGKLRRGAARARWGKR